VWLHVAAGIVSNASGIVIDDTQNTGHGGGGHASVTCHVR
jgi:hypothetical protein